MTKKRNINALKVVAIIPQGMTDKPSTVGALLFNAMEKQEIWKEIPGFNGRYQASTKGRIKSLRFRNSSHSRILKQSKQKQGYLILHLCNDKPKLYRVNRLIALTFIPNPENKYATNHKDGVKSNNYVTNLEWATKSENETHKHRVLGQPGTMTGRVGKDNPKSREINQLLLSGEFLCKWDNSRSIQQALGFDFRNVYACCRGWRKSAYGYKWKFTND